MLQITPPPAARTSGIARRVTSTSPNTLVSNMSRHSSRGVSSTGRCSRSTPALLTRTRRPSGRRTSSGRVTSNAWTRSRPSASAAMSDVVLAIAGGLRLDAVLDRLVHAARDLVDARYAALGIPDEDGTEFDQFLHAGMSDDLVAELGPLPRTHGMLGAMLSDPRPFRTDDITQDPRFRGWWPDAHPLMRSFLCVPIVAKGDIIGAFYLTEKEGAAGFDDADEKVITVLAARAASAIENARLFEASRELSVIEERNRLPRGLARATTPNPCSLALTADAAAGLVRTHPRRAAAENDRVRQPPPATQAALRALGFELRPPRPPARGLVATGGKDPEILR